MRLRICVCLCVKVHIRVFVCACVCVRVFMCVCANVCLLIGKQTFAHTQMHTYVQTFEFLCVCKLYVCMHVHPRMYVSIHECHACMYSQRSRSVCIEYHVRGDIQIRIYLQSLAPWPFPVVFEFEGRFFFGSRPNIFETKKT